MRLWFVCARNCSLCSGESIAEQVAGRDAGSASTAFQWWHRLQCLTQLRIHRIATASNMSFSGAAGTLQAQIWNNPRHGDAPLATFDAQDLRRVMHNDRQLRGGRWGLRKRLRALNKVHGCTCRSSRLLRGYWKPMRHALGLRTLQLAIGGRK